MKKILYSLKNTKIKNLIKSYKSINKKNKLFIVEGIKEFEMAVKGKFYPIEIFICDEIFEKYNLVKLFKSIIFYISIKVFQKISYRENSGGIIALFKEKKMNTLKNINICKKNAIILILDGIEKPGNIGSILRTANAVGVNMIILCNMKTYIFNSNVIRSSLGSIFTISIFIEKKMETIFHWLKKNNIKILTTGFHNNSHYVVKNIYKTKLYYDRIAIVFGSEDKGVSSIWLDKADHIINIPMFGDINSLNVSNAVSIIIYEIIRQKYYVAK
ncbi:TrmH family RNA methyltransferase [Blattabacterium cuenoti]|uniref:TrmH family RNA methyltransferase n=1 Tax=Blattabacterium cuenoti TaxID=1653831 RepID=UPI00163B9A8C|nr:RNA methyltransferase [Blattabacterium cuenoti]